MKKILVLIAVLLFSSTNVLADEAQPSQSGASEDIKKIASAFQACEDARQDAQNAKKISPNGEAQNLVELTEDELEDCLRDYQKLINEMTVKHGGTFVIFADTAAKLAGAI